MKPLLSLNNLHAKVEDKDVLRGVTLTIQPGELHVLMGPNGSGKSSLALTLFGHPRYTVTDGTITLDGTAIQTLPTHERARLGMFLSFQHPAAIPGVTVANIARTAARNMAGANAVDAKTFRGRLTSVLDELELSETFLERSVNDGFSGGEMKKSEMLQAGAIEPKLLVLDEPDSGLDIDALRKIAAMINKLRTADRGILLITHYRRLLDHLKPTAVHVFMAGAIVRSGGAEVAEELEKTGYQSAPSA
ncbi:MAG: Fe-S cluster assembly ATPase SufC [Candidatus Kerfeldbacteria bacterium]|nr:Fe-S cluster assembly ATPase SufC [Candidatus Kerfeldbacteria bacterium]